VVAHTRGSSAHNSIFIIVGGNSLAFNSATEPSRASKASINAGRGTRGWWARELYDADRRINTRGTPIDYCC
jgi:hypothetical protein